MSIAILILNYNGRDLLEKCLGSAVDAAAAYGHEHCQVVLVDNRSTDDSLEYVRAQHAEIEVVICPRNDYLFSLNEVIAKRTEEIVIILNNDMWVSPDFISPLLTHFADPALFAVTCGIRDWNGHEFSLTSRPSICTVRPEGSWYAETYEAAPDVPSYVQLASGGASAYRRSRFVELGGFDPLYRPGYCEDTDLSIRAWRRGWSIMYEPASVVHHLGSVSMKRAFGSRVHRLAMRNRVLMVAKLFGSRAEHTRFLALFVKRAIQNTLFMNRELGIAMWMALPRLPAALLSRSRHPIEGTVRVSQTQLRLHNYAGVLEPNGR